MGSGINAENPATGAAEPGSDDERQPSADGAAERVQHEQIHRKFGANREHVAGEVGAHVAHEANGGQHDVTIAPDDVAIALGDVTAASDAAAEADADRAERRFSPAADDVTEPLHDAEEPPDDDAEPWQPPPGGRWRRCQGPDDRGKVLFGYSPAARGVHAGFGG